MIYEKKLKRGEEEGGGVKKKLVVLCKFPMKAGFR